MEVDEVIMVKELCLAYEQLSKGMPVLKSLDPELEKLIQGQG